MEIINGFNYFDNNINACDSNTTNECLNGCRSYCDCLSYCLDICPSFCYVDICVDCGLNCICPWNLFGLL